MAKAAGLEAKARDEVARGKARAPDTAASIGDRSAASGETGELLALQRLAGNRVVNSLLARSAADVRAAGPAIVARTPAIVEPVQRTGIPERVQRAGGKKKRKNKRQRQRNQGQQGQSPKPATQTTPPTSTTAATSPPATAAPGGWGSGLLGTLSSYASALWSAPTVSGDGDGDANSYGEGDDKRSAALWESEDLASYGEAEPDEAPDPSKGLLDKLIDIPKIEISLEKEGAVMGGTGKASGNASYGAEGLSGKGKIEWAGALWEGERTPVDFTVLGTKLTSKGTFFGGAKGSGEFEATWTNEKVASKGKLAAFAGMEAQSETEVVMTVGGHDVTMKGALGVAIGLGGELSYWLSFEGGELRWGTKGKAALGAGATWEYELKLPVASLSSSMWSWLSWAGSSVLESLETLSYLE